MVLAKFFAKKSRILNLIKAAAGCNETSGHTQGFDRAVLLDRRHAGPVGLDTARDLDLPRRAAGLDAQADGGTP
jgi:hypothetical protein